MPNYNQEREALHRMIWDVANKLRGSIDGWTFKAYILGTIFYRYISEDLTYYIDNVQRKSGYDKFDYTALSDEVANTVKKEIVKEKGYFILPSQLFCNVSRDADRNENLNETLNRVFSSIEGSAMGTQSEENVRGLFSDYIVNSPQLGKSVRERNRLIAEVLREVGRMNFGTKFSETECDTFGDAYEFLMKMYASNAGKSGGEFFTPQEVSKVLVRLCQWKNDNIRKVYDPACGSGSLLLRFARLEGVDNSKLTYYGQEINPTTYNLCRSNMFLHGVNYSHFHIGLGDTLTAPMWLSGSPFDAIVSNPPYSIQWEGKNNPLLIDDPRFEPAGVLAPASKADLAFVMHIVYSLSETGTAAIVEFPGVLYRGGAEKRIREYLLDKNFVDTVIQLPANLFFGVSIATCIMVLKKNKGNNNGVLFINASEMCEKVGNKNRLRKEDQDRIVELYQEHKEVQYVSKWVKNEDLMANGCNLSVSSYVEQEDKREEIDIEALNKEISEIVKMVNELRANVDLIVKELGRGKL